MVKSTAAHPFRLTHAEDEPIIFYGPPRALSGTLKLQNTANEKVKLTSIPFEVPNVLGPGGVPLSQVKLSARLYPQQQLRVPTTLELDPSTPPGTYEGTIQLGDRRQAVRVHVTEHIDLKIEPSQISLYTEGERKFSREIIVENAGNVPVRGGSTCLVPLSGLVELRAAILQGLEGACDADLEKLLNKFLCAWTDQEVGPLLVTREDITFAPGETRPVTITFNLPNNLRRFHRYVVDLPIYSAQISLEIITGDWPKRSQSDRDVSKERSSK